MLAVAVAVLAATALGILCERRYTTARTIARWALSLMVYVLLPFASFVTVAHTHVTAASGAGLGFAYVAVCTAGLLAWAIGRFGLRLPPARLGVVICSVVVVNTGYLGLPMTIALLGQSALGPAVTYDQLVSTPSLFLLGFGVGAMFGNQAGEPARRRLRTFFTRNPPLWAVIAGLLAPPWLAPAPLPAVSHVVVGALLVIGFFTVGIHLSAGRAAYGGALLGLPKPAVWLALVLRLIVSPLIVTGMSRAVVTVPHAYLLEAAMASGISVLLIAHVYGLDERLAATIIVWSTAVVIIVGLLVQAL